MAISKARETRRLKAALVGKIEDALRERDALKEQVRQRDDRIDQLVGALRESKRTASDLRAAVRIEEMTRIAAQRGLVAYMKEHGLDTRIGYDPDKDEGLAAARQELEDRAVAEGRPRNKVAFRAGWRAAIESTAVSAFRFIPQPTPAETLS